MHLAAFRSDNTHILVTYQFLASSMTRTNPRTPSHEQDYDSYAEARSQYSGPILWLQPPWWQRQLLTNASIWNGLFVAAGQVSLRCVGDYLLCNLPCCLSSNHFMLSVVFKKMSPFIQNTVRHQQEPYHVCGCIAFTEVKRAEWDCSAQSAFVIHNKQWYIYGAFQWLVHYGGQQG